MKVKEPIIANLIWARLAKSTDEMGTAPCTTIDPAVLDEADFCLAVLRALQTLKKRIVIEVDYKP